MSKEFIQAQLNKTSIQKAARQERQLEYFLQSELQEENITSEYLQAWAERKYKTNDYFLSYVKSVFKAENFLSFFKYFRKPIPSAKLINNKIRPQLNRVFVAENSDFKYDVTNVDYVEIKETLDIKDFQEELFDKILFKHNSILIEDLDSENPNEPYRYYLDIDNVISLDHNNKRITQIAFGGCIEVEEKEIEGIIYIDDDSYQFYDKEYNLISDQPHDLGECPADFITKNKYKGNFIIRESIFTYIREELEEYNFLKTLQKMTEPNGAIPIVTKLDVEQEGEDVKGSESEPSADNIMGSQRAEFYNELNNGTGGELQPGTIHGIPLEAVRNDEGSINMELVTNYINFFYTPVEALNYLKERIAEIENSIISTIIGTIDISNSTAVNEMQIEKSIIVLENTLILLANTLNYIRKKSDTKMLALKYGIERVNEVFIFYGTDFFLEPSSLLFQEFEKSTNPIERKNILIRINQNKYKNNPDQLSRQKILYELMPYISDVDFDKARASTISPMTTVMEQYYLRFNDWIGQFEAQYGDIVSFYKDIEGDKSQKLKLIDNLILAIINENIANNIT